MKVKAVNLLLAAVLLLATFLAFFQPKQAVPPSLDWDEASLGYNAYSILKTGKDEWGRFLPLTFEAFGDYKLPGYIYADVPFQAALGLNEFSTRLPSQLAGIVSVLLAFLIVKKLTNRRMVALAAAFLLTISPWHTFLSRAAFEANLALCLFLAGFYFFLRFKEKSVFLTLSSLFFGLTIFTYNAARVFLPLFLITLVFFYRKDLIILKRKLVLPLLVIGMFIGVAGYLALSQDSSSRYYWVRILDQGAINNINQSRGESTLPPQLARLTNNKYTYFIESAAGNYLSYLSPKYLFFEGGSNHQLSVPGTGMFYPVFMPFILLGLWELWKDKKYGKLLILALILAPLPGAITRDSPHVLRSVFLLGLIPIIAAFGIESFVSFFTGNQIKIRQFLAMFIVLLFLISGYGYVNKYFFEYPVKEAFAWQYGMKQAIGAVNKYNPEGMKKVYISKIYGEPHIYYLFFNKYDPSKYQNNPTLIRFSRSNWRWVDRLDNIYFVEDAEIKDKVTPEKGALVVTSPANYPPNSRYLESVYFLDGSRAFDIVVIN